MRVKLKDFKVTIEPTIQEYYRPLTVYYLSFGDGLIWTIGNGIEGYNEDEVEIYKLILKE